MPVPDGDLFKAISDGPRRSSPTASTRSPSRASSSSPEPSSQADLIVTATGLNMLALGGMEIAVDGREVELPETMSYKGMMLSGVPNLALAIGYTNASWTLKCDLTCEYVCRLLRHMDEHGYSQCVPENRDPSVAALPFIDFSSGYVQRAIDKFPRQGSKAPWRLYQNYALDILSLKFGAVEDDAMQFSRAASPRRCSRADRRLAGSSERPTQRPHARAGYSASPASPASSGSRSPSSPRSAGSAMMRMSTPGSPRSRRIGSARSDAEEPKRRRPLGNEGVPSKT